MERGKMTNICIGLPYINKASPNLTLETNYALDEFEIKTLPHFKSDYFHCQEPQVLRFENLRSQNEDSLWNFMMRNKIVFRQNPHLLFSYNDCNSQFRDPDNYTLRYKTDLSPCIAFFIEKLQEHHIIVKSSNWSDKLGLNFNPDRPLEPRKTRMQRFQLWVNKKFKTNRDQPQYLSKFLK